YKGNSTDGYAELGLEASSPTLWARLGLGSIAVSDQGEITIATSRAQGSNSSWLEIYRYNEADDKWDFFDTTGMNVASSHINHLRYDNDGVLHFIHSGSRDAGFLFKYTGQTWEHIGPENFPGLFEGSAQSPHL